MLSLRHIPQPPLSALVECLWYWEGAPATHAKERLLPNGESAIIVNLRDEPIRVYDARDITRCHSYGHAVLSGARSNCFVIDTRQQERVVGIQFRPGGAFPFFRMPASEVEGASIALDDVWPGRAVRDIREQLLAAPGVDAMFAILECSLLAQLARPPELHPAVAYALRNFCHCPSGSRVASVTERVGLSPRRFIELFHRQVGLTPKTFSRVRRFQQALRSVHGRSRIDWAQVALDNGYYDQAHFIHDFQGFSGFTPSAYSSLATAHLNHVPLL
ncbi:MAG: AraC family transcriptional regulator [Bryobacteraceae bacterium]|jgi:AraC-like DNA-binding protein